ncbi:MAG: preprotein translocase subunit SecE [Firmicutes bacterium]|nr:preprotein translocase subunit SecE [Bacillota bacterium]
MAKAKDKETTKKRVPAAPPKKKRGSLKDYFKGVKLEMKKVVWPTKQELGSYTVVVLVTCAAFAVVFWAVDTGFLAALKGLLGITM